MLANRAIELLGQRGRRQRPAGRLQRGQPQRPREHGPVDQRHVPHGDARRDARPDARGARSPSTSWRPPSPSAPQAFDGVLKSGRTHMQDAVPIRLGQEFAAYALTIRRARDRILQAAEGLAEQNIGATAVGTGLNAEPEYIAPGRPVPLRADRLPAAHRRAPGPGDPVDGADARPVGGAARPRGRPGQDHGGPAADVVGAADRLRRDPPAGEAARLLDHARQGEPGDGREPVDDLLPRHRQRHGGGLVRLARPARAERDDAA